LQKTKSKDYKTNSIKMGLNKAKYLITIEQLILSFICMYDQISQYFLMINLDKFCYINRILTKDKIIMHIINKRIDNKKDEVINKVLNLLLVLYIFIKVLN